MKLRLSEVELRLSEVELRLSEVELRLGQVNLFKDVDLRDVTLLQWLI